MLILLCKTAASISFTIGHGGSSGSNAGAGQETSITVNAFSVIASGGTGATNTSTGVGGSWSVTAGFTNYFAINGQAGRASRLEFHEASNNVFIETSGGGEGGNGEILKIQAE